MDGPLKVDSEYRVEEHLDDDYSNRTKKYLDKFLSREVKVPHKRLSLSVILSGTRDEERP